MHWHSVICNSDKKRSIDLHAYAFIEHKRENTDTKDENVFLFLLFYGFFKDYKFSGRNVLLMEMQSFSDAEMARVI